ncbi:MAG: hypothetical protein IJX92_06630 [Clostridia bacterium]|nr:hypothetical protein [Clostridia bacterium]
MKDLITEERLKKCREARTVMREGYFEKAASVIGDEGVRELRELYNIFDEGYYLWLASLYDPKIGGFYFSRSGRDTEGFLPDIESTVQALNCAQNNGLTYGKPSREVYSDNIKAALVKFAQSLQDSENGYFYHPQWGRNINTPRRGRDLGWSTKLFNMFDAKPLYPTPLVKNEDGKKSAYLPEYLQSIDAFKKYLSEFNLAEKSYWIGNMLQSQASQIRAAGDEFVRELFSWLKAHQRADNGLWQEVVNYDSVNGLMKLSLIYSALSEPIPNAIQGLQSAITAALSDQEIVFCCQFYNPFSTINSILSNIAKFDSKTKADDLRAQIIAKAPAIIKRTREKVSLCRLPDGSFAYNPYYYERKSYRSQMAPVSLGLKDDADVNGACICLSGAVGNMCQALGIGKIPAFCDEDANLFHDILNNAEQYPKINPKPDWFDSCLVPEGTVWN